MINFFRKTRKKMADDNRPLKYMRYAIGEIALVVIGILIALSINNWNEERKLLLIEHALYKKLISDLRNEELILKGIIRFVKTFQDVNYQIYHKAKGKFNSDSVTSHNSLQFTITYRPRIKDLRSVDSFIY